MNRITNEMRMVSIHGIYSFSSGLTSVFLNVYLYTYTNSIPSMVLFSLVRSLFIPIGFTIGGKLSRRHSYPLILSLGLCCMLIELLFVLLINDGFALLPLLVTIPALLVGLGEGFLWLSINSLNQIVTKPETVSRYLSTVGIWNNIFTVIAPLVASAIFMTNNSDLAGYRWIFKLVVIIYIILIGICVKISCKNSCKAFHVFTCLLSSSKTWNTLMVSTILLGLNNSLALVINGLLLYDDLHMQGFAYSLCIAFFAFVTIISYWLYKKYMTKRYIIVSYIIADLVISTTTMALIFIPNRFGGFFYGILNGILIVPHSNGSGILSMNEISKLERENNENMTGRVIAKEVFLGIGRIIGLLLILICYQILPERFYLETAVTIISGSTIANAILIYKANKAGIICIDNN